MATDLSQEYIDEQIKWMEMNDFAEGAAEGTIQGDPEKLERLDEATERIGRGEFHKEIDWDHELRMLLARCVDGRIPEDGANPLAPNSAGGTESLMVADDLTTKRFAGPDGTTLSAYENIVAALVSNGYAVGGHTDSHASGEKSGCGANDKLELIYAYIAKRGDVLRHIASELGITVDDDTHELITGNAKGRTQFSKGGELLEALRAKAEEEFVDELHGDHNEVVTAINMRAGTTLDRDALAAEFGPEYQAFNVDAWAFEAAAQATSLDDPTEVKQKVAALVYYNLATALVLAGPNMRVVVLS